MPGSHQHPCHHPSLSPFPAASLLLSLQSRKRSLFYMHCKLSGKKQTNKKQKSIQLFSIQSPSIPSTTESYLHHLLEVVCWMLFQWTTSFAFIQQPWGENKKTHSLKHRSINQSNKKKNRAKGFGVWWLQNSNTNLLVYISNNKTKWKQKKKVHWYSVPFFVISFFVFFFFASTKDRDSSVPISTHEVKLMQSKAPKKLCNTKASQQTLKKHI